MKKEYILILSILFLILGMSYVCAVDNDTSLITDQNQDLISVNEQENDTFSVSNEENEIFEVADENSSNLTNGGEVLGVCGNGEILEASSSNDFLGSSVSVNPIISSGYKTPTKNQRTFAIGNFKAVLTTAQYKKLYLVTYVEDYFFNHGYDYYTGYKYKGYDVAVGGLRYNLEVKTNKIVKVKVKIRNKYVYRKSRVYMHFSYGEGQCGVAYRYMIYLTHKFANPGYDYAKVMGKSAKYFGKCKQSRLLPNVKKCKLVKASTVYRKYSYYNL